MKYKIGSGTIRLYDGTGSPYYLKMDFDNGDFTAPMGTPRTEEILVLFRGTMNSDGHYIEGSDEAVMAPLDLSFSAVLENGNETTYLLNWLKAMNDALATTVNSNTLVSTEADTQRDGSNNNPGFADSNKGTCNIEIRWVETNAQHLSYNEVYFSLAEQSIAESEDAVTITLSGKVYGTIEIDTSAFTSGTDVTA